MSIMVGKRGSRQAWWQEQQAENSYLQMQAASRESKPEGAQGFQLVKLSPMTHSPARLCLPIIS